MLITLSNTPSNRVNIINGYRAIIVTVFKGYRGSRRIGGMLRMIDGGIIGSIWKGYLFRLYMDSKVFLLN
jgi:hypothetical protein